MEKKYIWWMTNEELINNFRNGLINRVIPAFSGLPTYIGNLLCWIHEVGYRAHATAFSFNKQHKNVEEVALGNIQGECAEKVGLVFNDKDLERVKAAMEHHSWSAGKLTDFQLNPVL